MSDQLSLFGAMEPKPEPKPEPESKETAEQALEETPEFRLSPDLITHFEEIGLVKSRLHLAFDLVRLEPGLSPVESWALFYAVILGLEAQSQGSTYVPLPAAEEPYFSRRLRWYLPDDGPSADRLMETLQALLVRRDLAILGDPGEFKPLIVEGGRLYHQRMYQGEARMNQALARRLERVETPRDSERVSLLIQELRRRPTRIKDRPIALNDEQELAAREALFRPLTLITGGPGTGKTSIVVAILRLLAGIGVNPEDIALAAPTGKAANRMAESISAQLDSLPDPSPSDQALIDRLPPPSTLHRLLGFSPRRGSFNFHEKNPLRQKMVIVDEASMIDLFLMDHLFRATAPQSNLVLLGDADQLPSVDVGAVLRDIIGPGKAIELKKSYRMRPDDPAGREILTFAGAVRTFRGGRLEVSAAGDEVLPAGVRLGDPELRDFARRWFDEALLGGDRQRWRSAFNATYEIDEDGTLTPESARQLADVLAHHGRARVLTLTRVFPTGSVALNQVFHEFMASLGRERAGADFAFHPGEPVMMLRNDYDRQLFNGDQGVVMWCQRQGAFGGEAHGVRLMAIFERAGRLVAFPLGELRRDLEHSFALTVHKAQGSEYEHVALVLPRERSLLLTRELLYTAVTRASRGVLILGAREILERGAASAVVRRSGVGA